MSLRHVSLALGLFLLAGSTASTRAEPVGSTVPVDLSLRTTRPAGAVFVMFFEGTFESRTKRYLASTMFTAHKPEEAVELSFEAPSGEGEIQVAFLNALNLRPRAIRGLLKVNFSRTSARHLDVSEADERGLSVCLENCEVRPLPASGAALSSAPSGTTVSATLTLTTPMPAGAVFVEWSGVEGARTLAGRTFIDHPPTEPIEVRFEAPVGTGAFKVSLQSGDAREAHLTGPIGTTLSAGATPQLVAVEPAGKPGDEHPPMLQVSLDGALRSP